MRWVSTRRRGAGDGSVRSRSSDTRLDGRTLAPGSPDPCWVSLDRADDPRHEGLGHGEGLLRKEGDECRAAGAHASVVSDPVALATAEEALSLRQAPAESVVLPRGTGRDPAGTRAELASGLRMAAGVRLLDTVSPRRGGGRARRGRGSGVGATGLRGSRRGPPPRGRRPATGRPRQRATPLPPPAGTRPIRVPIIGTFDPVRRNLLPRPVVATRAPGEGQTP